MSKAILAAIPIKPFGVAKRRLSDRLDGETRRLLGQAIASRTAAAAIDAGALVAVVTADSGVARWARTLGYLTIDERIAHGHGLNGAAEAVVVEAVVRQRPWAIIHADLPLVTPGALRRVFAHAAEKQVLVPSHDGGTNIVAGHGPGFRFSYGKSSFHRHLATNPTCAVIPIPSLALDLDTKEDLSRALSLPGGEWLRRHVR